MVKPKPTLLPKPQVFEPNESAFLIPDDDRLASRLVEDWPDYSYFYNTWHKYQEGVWRQLHEAQIQRQVRDYLREQRHVHPRLRLTKNLIMGVNKLAELDKYVDSMEVNNGKQYLNLKNGLLNLDTLKVEPHRPDTYFTWQLDFGYDEEASCKNFLNYLNTSLVLEDGVTPDWQMIYLVQEALGYSLTADTSRKACFWVVGPRDSGKSTLLAIVRKLMGAMHTPVNLNDLAENKYLLATLAGKRVVTCTEANAGSTLPDGIFKMLVGGEDEIQADVKHKDPISFVPECKLWWGMNDMPRVRDRSGAVFSRINLIVFPRTIPAELKINGLLDIIATELPGILNWAITGLIRMQRRGGFIEPKASQKKMDEFKLLNDPEALFLSECAVLDTTIKTAADDLQRAIKNWRRENGYPSKSMIRTKSELRRFGVTYQRQNDRGYYHGLYLNDDGKEYATQL